MNQAYMQVRLNIILAHLQHKGSFPDLAEVEHIARYCVDGPSQNIIPVSSFQVVPQS
jgi:hypothetical protein